MVNESSKRQARWWFGTLSLASAGIALPEVLELLSQRGHLSFSTGQVEIGAGGFEHWQFVVVCTRSRRLSWLRENVSESCHWEPVIDRDSALAYVTKDDTAVAGTRFQVGQRPVDRSSSSDWDEIRRLACSGRLESVPSDIYIRYCIWFNIDRTLKTIHVDHMEPVATERVVHVYYGKSGTGKTHRAWAEAGMDAYVKDPVTKWWCGYRSQQRVILGI